MLLKSMGVKKIIPGRIVGLIVILLFIAGCGTATVASLAVTNAQPTPTLQFDIEHAPTPPVVSPIVVKVAVSPAPNETSNADITSEPQTGSFITSTAALDEDLPLLPTATPTSIAQSVPLGEIALPVSTAVPDPLATISVQLEQPIPNTGGATEAETPAGGDQTSAPPIPEDSSPMPVVNVSTAPLVIPGDMSWDGTPRTAHVPILMYHYVSTPPPNADIYRKDLSVSPELFSTHLDRIRAEGYTTISLYDLLNYLAKGVPLPEKPLIISFDDGYRDNYENAFPILKAHGMTATFFVVMEFINGQRPEYMTWEMLREMQNAGNSIEAHGVEHVTLKKRDRDFLVFHALRSYETLQNELGHRARFISYPAGQYDQNTIDVFKSAGYWAGITTIQGATHSTDNLFELRRVRVRGTTSPDQLLELLQADW